MSAGVSLVGGVVAIGYSGNTIAFSGNDGVFVSTPSTTCNPILYNSIYGNNGRGIALSAGGNDELQVENTGSVGVGKATGTILNLDEIPPGSIIQLFSGRRRCYKAVPGWPITSRLPPLTR